MRSVIVSRLGIVLILLGGSFLGLDASAQMFSNWDPSGIYSAWVQWLQGASSAQSCPSLAPGKVLSLGKVVEVGAREVGDQDVYVVRAAYGSVDDAKVNGAIKLIFKYSYPCQNCGLRSS